MTATAVDRSLLKAHPRLVEYLIEGHCKRLGLYLLFAQTVLVLNKFLDNKYNQKSNNYVTTLAENQTLREYHVADYIKETLDLDLVGVIEAQSLGTDPTPICHLFARLVIGHETDQNCEKILEELRSTGIVVPTVVCDCKVQL